MKELLQTDLYRLVEGRHGRFLSNPKDMYIGRSMIEYGEFSELEWQLLEQLVRPGQVVIEAGANMGSFTVPIAKKLGRNGILYAFEPQLAIFQQLCANLALNDLVNVQAFNAGCGDDPGWMGIIRPDPGVERNYGGFRLNQLEGNNQTRVRIEKLDDALDPPRLDLIKADVEGMEEQVLRGAEGLIAKFRPMMYLEAHDAKDTPGQIALLEEMDYRMWWHRPWMFNKENFAGNEENHFGNVVSNNILCIPAERKSTINGARPVTGPDDHPSKWPRPG